MDAWANVRACFAPLRRRIEDGLDHAPSALKPLTQRVIDVLAREETPTAEVDLHAAMLVLFGANQPKYEDVPPLREVTALHIALGGLTFALEAAVAATKFSLDHSRDATIGAEDVWMVPRIGPVDPQPWIAVRRAIAEARPEEREVAGRWALERSRRPETEPGVRFALAWALPSVEELWTEDDARYGLICERDPGHIYVLAALRKQTFALRAGWYLHGMPDPEEIVKHLGPRSVPVLRAFIERDDGVASLIASFGGVDAVGVLAEHADLEKYVLPTFLGAVLADPASGVAAITQVLAKESPRQKRRSRRGQRPLLRPILEATLRWLVPPSDTPEPEAAEADLPEPLRSPPWSSKAPEKQAAKTKPKSQTPDATSVRAVAYDERLDWGERDPATLFWVDVSRTEHAVARALEDDTFFLHRFSWVDDATGRRLVLEVPASRWYGNVDELEGLLARFGLDALAPVLAYVKRQPDRFPALRSVDSPRVAPLAAHLFANSKKVKEAASAWLLERPRAASVGLVAGLATEKGKAREAMAAALQFVRDHHPDIVAETVDAAGAGATEMIDSARAASARSAIKEPKLPPFVDLSRIARPRLANGKGRLSSQATKTLLCLLTQFDRRAPSLWSNTVRDACEPASLDAFVWSVFVPWLGAGGPPKFGAGLDVLGLFGSDDTLRCLAEVAREWAPGGVPIRAQAAVDVLALAPRLAGIEGIHRLTQVQSRALARHAEIVLDAVAKARGMTAQDLIDQLIPDLGFEADGTMTLEVGKRSFSVRFDDEMRPHLVDAEGAKRAELPAARDGDELGAAAVARWKTIKKEAKAIFKEQTRRLELALAVERRLPVDRFEGTFAKHPLLQHLVRRFVWIAENTSRGVSFAFRVAEDGAYASVADRTVSLEPDLVVGLLHPLRCVAADVATWAQQLADYDIIQPFDQLARSTYALADEERDHEVLERATGWRVPTGSVLGLSKLGWTRGDAGQGGRVHEWEKHAQLGIVAKLSLDPGIYLGSPLEDPEQTLGPVVFVSQENGEPMTLRDVDPLVFSELVRDLETLRPT